MTLTLAGNWCGLHDADDPTKLRVPIIVRAFSNPEFWILNPQFDIWISIFNSSSTLTQYTEQ